MRSAATFKPGEITATNKTERVDSRVDAQAGPRNPTNKLAMAGKIQRKNKRIGMSMDFIRRYGASAHGNPVAGAKELFSVF
ncbi:MAG: hypothetical protein WA765_15605 [Candidatus Acidiferrum sp.]